MSTEASTPTMEMINDLQALILQNAEITTAIAEILSTLNKRVTKLEEKNK